MYKYPCGLNVKKLGFVPAPLCKRRLYVRQLNRPAFAFSQVNSRIVHMSPVE